MKKSLVKKHMKIKSRKTKELEKDGGLVHRCFGIFIMVAFVAVFIVALVSAIQVTTFSNSLTSENLTFNGDQNISRNITLPRNAVVNSATMNISGRFVTGDIIQDEESSASSVLGTSSYGSATWGTTSTLGRGYDEDGFSYQYVFVNPYYVEAQTFDSYIYENFSRPDSYSSISLNYRVANNGVTPYAPFKLHCRDGGSWTSVVDITTTGPLIDADVTLPSGCADETIIGIRSTLEFKADGVNWFLTRLYENVLTFVDGSKYPSNPYMEVGTTDGGSEWNYVGEYSTTETTSDFSSELTSALNGGLCDCTGCTLVDDECFIETIFHSDEPGKLEYSDIQIDYTSAPFVTLEIPANDTWAPYTKEFNCSATDEEQLANLTFYFYDSAGDLNLSVTQDLTGTSNSTTYEMTFSSTETYTWTCSAYNNNSREWWADDNFTIKIDNDNPSISFITTNNTITTDANLDITFSISDANLESCWYSNDTNTINNSLTCGDNITDIVWAEGTHNVTVYANDSSGKESQDTLLFIIDQTPPVSTVLMTSPPDGPSYSNNTWTNESIKATISVYDVGGFDNLAYPEYCVDTINSCTPDTHIEAGVTITTEGISYIRYRANDTAGNLEATQSRTLKIDTTTPIFDTIPADDSITYGEDWVGVNFDASDSGSGIDSYFTNDSLFTINSTGFLNEVSTLGGGTYSINVSVNDTVGKINSTTYTLTVNKAILSASITNGTLLTRDYDGTSTIIGIFETNTGDGDVDYKLYVDGVDEGPSYTQSSAGVYSIVLNSTGGENYTANSSIDSETLTINRISPTLHMGITGTTPITYLTTSNFAGSETNTGDGGCSYSMDLTNAVYGVGTTTFNYSTSGCTNYTAGYVTKDLVVNKATLSGSLSGTTPITYLTAGDVEGTESNTGDGGVTYKLYREGVEVSNADTTVLGAGTYNYIYNSTGGANYSTNASLDTFSLTVDKAVPSAFLNSDLGWTINETQEVIINLSESNTGDGGVTYIIYRDGVSKTTGETWIPAYGTYDYVLNTTGGANWTINSSMDIQTLTVNDIINPTISIISLSNNTNSSDSGLNITYLAEDTNLDSCWWTNDSGSTNTTLTGCVNITSQTWNEGITNLIIYVNDSSGNENSTDITFRIDITPPSLSILYPEDGSTYDSLHLDLNYSVSDSGVGLDTCWYKNNSDPVNITVPCGTNTSITQIDGTHTVYMWANDTLGNEVSTSNTYTISTSAPAITLVNPTNDTQSNTQSIIFNYTVIDTNGVDTCQLWGSWGGWQLVQSNDHGGDLSVDANEGNFSEIIGDGSYIWTVWCNDTDGVNDWYFNNWTLLIDTVYPLIDFDATTSANNTNTTDDYIFINISTTELNFANITLALYDSDGEVNLTTFTTETSEINFTDLPDEIYYYNVTIVDTAGNTNSTETRVRRLDDTKPTITINSPQAQNYGDNTNVTLNYSTADNLIGLDICWYEVQNSTGYPWVSTTTLSSCQNTSFALPSGDTDYTLSVWSKDLLGNTNSESVTFGIRTESPVVVITPINDTHSNSLTDNQFNVTVTTNADSISNCSLYGDFNGTWMLNQTIINPADGVETNFTNINLTEGSFSWDVLCYDNLGISGWGLNNHTYVTDITYPNISINYITTTKGSQTIRFNTTTNDTNEISCKYSVYDSSLVIDGLNENVSFTCQEEELTTVTAYGNYTLKTYVTDKAGNENSTNQSFITSPSEDGGGGGGGGGEDIEKIPTIALQEIEGERTYDELERAIFYARINTFCSVEKTSQVLAIQDFSGECSLKKSNIETIVGGIALEGFVVSVNDFILFYDKYNTKELEQVYMASEIIKVNSLFTSVLGITNPMIVNPPRLDRPFIIMDADGNITIEHVFTVNKEVKECAIISGEGFGCEVITDNSVKMTLYIEDADFFDKIFQGEMSITSDADPENIEIKRISLIPRVYNLSYNILGVPVIVLLVILGLLILVVAVFLIFRGKIRKKLRSRR